LANACELLLRIDPYVNDTCKTCSQPG